MVVKGWESTQLVLRRKSIPWPKYIRNQFEDNYYEEEAENIESNSDDNNHVEPDENEAENIENDSIPRR